jgi:hypothetical protein
VGVSVGSVRRVDGLDDAFTPAGERLAGAPAGERLAGDVDTFRRATAYLVATQGPSDQA